MMPRSPKHVGLSVNRLPDNPDEQTFAKMWSEEAPRVLTHLIGDGSQYHSSYSQRDATVAATIIQWLGSPVGNAFVRDAQTRNELRRKGKS
jgi:hypothetical protein